MSLELLWEHRTTIFASHYLVRKVLEYDPVCRFHTKYGNMPSALARWAWNKERIDDKHVCLQSMPIQLNNFWKTNISQSDGTNTNTHTLSLFLSAFFVVVPYSNESALVLALYSLICIENRSTQIGSTTINIMNLQFCLLTFLSWLNITFVNFFREIYLKRVTNIDCILMKSRMK